MGKPACDKSDSRPPSYASKAGFRHWRRAFALPCRPSTALCRHASKTKRPPGGRVLLIRQLPGHTRLHGKASLPSRLAGS